MTFLFPLALALAASEPATGPWHAYLRSSGGDIPFELELSKGERGWSASIANGEETIDVPDVRVEKETLRIEFPHYDSAIEAKVERDGEALSGEWSKRAGPSAWKRMPFFATHGAAPRFPKGEGRAGEAGTIDGRWYVRFSKTKEPAVAIFASKPGGVASGTFLTSTGDHRYLAGAFDDGVLRLSCFDGAHAFLYEARLGAGGRELDGRFQSGESWNERWSASRDDKARLEGEMSRARWVEGFPLAELAYPDLDDRLVPLEGHDLAGRARILQLSGSWCPNCQDETRYLAELDAKYRSKGLSVVALCFEVTGDRTRDAEQARRMRSRNGAEYRFLLAGSSDKELAGQAFPALDRVHAFPTTIFVDRSGRVRAVHSGFSGPATGEAYSDLKARFERLVGEILAAPAKSPLEDVLLAQPWRDVRDRNLIAFTRAENGSIVAEAHEMTRFDGPTATGSVRKGIVICGTSSADILAMRLWYDARAQTFLDPLDVAHRLVGSSRAPFPSVDGQGEATAAAVAAGLTSTDATLRRESAFWLAHGIVSAQMAPPDEAVPFDPGLAVNLVPLLDDPDPLVRRTAAWSCGVLRVEAAQTKLVANLDHGFAPVRREAARALGALKARSAKAALEARAQDLDPLVREEVGRALAALE